jgi:arylsulfatase A-like enzyme
MKLFLLFAAFCWLMPLHADETRPNVILILADDLGYGDLGCYGQSKIKTPNLDHMAEQGMRFTQCYAGSTVCAPSRCALMTGKHTGHTTVRGNRKIEVPLRSNEKTIAEVFADAGYETAMFGKWGVGGNDTSGAPNRKGFKTFLGYLTQHEAHNYYPSSIYRDMEVYPLPENEGGQQKLYTHDLFMREALKWVRANAEKPFFLYLPITIPHANNEAKPNGMQVPSDAPYSQEKWPQQEKNFAAMITRLDSGVGQIMALLKELKIDENTLVIFTSDNGPHEEGGHKADFFNSNGALRGIKRDLYEGGIRVPTIMRWPGKIRPGVVSEQIWASWDLLPTFCELTDEPLPNDLDGISFVPALLENKIVTHPPLYWEFYEGGFAQAVRDGKWKAVKNGGQEIELFDLMGDVSETKDVAAQNPEIVQRMHELMDNAHTDSPDWEMPRNAPVKQNPTNSRVAHQSDNRKKNGGKSEASS